MINMATEQTKFRFNGYRVIKSEIHLARSGEIDKTLNVTFSGIRSSEQGSEYALDLGVSVSNPDRSLDIQMEMRGFFEFDSDLSPRDKALFFTASAPAIMFPYLRAHISTLTAISGIEPLVLPTINFVEGLRQAKETD